MHQIPILCQAPAVSYVSHTIRTQAAGVQRRSFSRPFMYHNFLHPTILGDRLQQTIWITESLLPGLCRNGGWRWVLRGIRFHLRRLPHHCGHIYFILYKIPTCTTSLVSSIYFCPLTFAVFQNDGTLSQSFQHPFRGSMYIHKVSIFTCTYIQQGEIHEHHLGVLAGAFQSLRCGSLGPSGVSQLSCRLFVFLGITRGGHSIFKFDENSLWFQDCPETSNEVRPMNDGRSKSEYVGSHGFLGPTNGGIMKQHLG